MEMFEDKLDKQMKEAYRKIREDLKDQAAGPCLDEETLICYLEERLAKPEVEEVEKHLSLCSKCNEYVIFMNRINQLDIEEELPHPPEELTKKTIALDRKEKKDTPVKTIPDLIGSAIDWMGMTLHRFRQASFVLATAAAVALVVLVVLSVKSPQRESPVQSPSFELETRIVAREDAFKDAAYSYMEKSVPKARSKRVIMDEEGRLLRSGDCFQVVIKANQESYLYVFIHDSKGEVTQLFPDPSLKDTEGIMTDVEYVLPCEDKWFPMDEDSTSETMYMIATSKPFQNTDRVTKTLRTDGIKKLKDDFGSIIISTKSFKIVHADDKSLRGE